MKVARTKIIYSGKHNVTPKWDSVKGGNEKRKRLKKMKSSILCHLYIVFLLRGKGPYFCV